MQQKTQGPSSLKPVIHGYAQTNLQLYNQMLRQDYCLEDIASMKQAYELAIALFNGQYRGNAKPFLNHLVGTASILLSRELPTQLAIAGLLHASYSHGKFSFPRFNIRVVKQRKLQNVLGTGVENLIIDYTHLHLTASSLRAMAEHPETLSEKRRSAIVMRLANDLEDHLDNGLLYCGKSKSLYDSIDSSRHLASLADFLGQSQLYAEIQRRRGNHSATAVPDILRSAQNDSFKVPASPTRLLRRKLKALAGRYG